MIPGNVLQSPTVNIQTNARQVRGGERSDDENNRVNGVAEAFGSSPSAREEQQSRRVERLDAEDTRTNTERRQRLLEDQQSPRIDVPDNARADLRDALGSYLQIQQSSQPNPAASLAGVDVFA